MTDLEYAKKIDNCNSCGYNACCYTIGNEHFVQTTHFMGEFSKRVWILTL
jgi:hypothetical protein